MLISARFAGLGARRPFLLCNAYVTVVSLAGLAVVLVAAPGGGQAIRHAPVALWVLTGFIVAGDLVQLPIPHRTKLHFITCSNPFAFAVLLGWGAKAAILAYAAASVIGDLAHHKPLKKLSFNAAQYALSLGAAGVVYGLLGGDGLALDARNLVAFAAAAAVYLVVNTVLVRVVVGLYQHAPLAAYLRVSTSFEATVAVVEFATTSIALLVVQRPLVLAPLLALPIVAIALTWRLAARLANALNEAEQARALAEALLRQQQERHRQQDQALRMVAHELRDPLDGILSLTSTLLELPPGRTLGDCRELLDAVCQHAHHAKADTDQLLVDAQAPPELTAAHRQLVVVDAAELVRQACQVAAFTDPDRRFELEVTGPLLVGGPIHAIDQILTNLVGNAVKHTTGGEIRLEAAAAGTQVVLAVEDEGPGIPASERERIFERFTRLPAADGTRGLGLGLAIAHGLTEHLGGELVATDPVRHPHGARFELRLPLLSRSGRSPWAGETGVVVQSALDRSV